MNVHLIRNDKDYDKIMKEIVELAEKRPSKDPAAMEKLEILTMLVKHFDEKHHVIPPPDPVEAIKFRMEQLGLSRKDVIPYFGTKNRVSEILGRKRKISPRIALRLHKTLNIPGDAMLKGMA
jgi:HTH-type transcriptional regulator/antitoxin HigA